MHLECAASTHVGRRTNNEDAHCVHPELGLFAVADGMGGYEGGEVASRIAIETLLAFVQRNAADGESTWPIKPDPTRSLDENMLVVGTLLAHRTVCDHKTPALARMGSTLVALRVNGANAVLAHVGDSRIYRLRAGRLTQLTRDHSVYSDLLASGAKDLPPRAQHPFGNYITRALGTDRAHPDVTTVPIQRGDTFLLCSDGLHESLEESEVITLADRANLRDACVALVESAYVAGSKDNITAVLVRAG